MLNFTHVPFSVLSTPVPPEKIGDQAASAVILNDRDEILLMMRDDMPLWTNIGGYVDPGEDFETALHRETMEETGCEIAIIRFIGDFYTNINSPTLYEHEHVYLAHVKPGWTPSLQDEGTFVRWFHKDALPVNMGPLFHRRIHYALANHPQPVSVIQNDPNMPQFLATVTDFSPFVALDEWLHHPRVVAKREAGKLRFDPLLLI
ncbi:MAG TPA: NUDIX hydrolase [Alphaproteobacteria bacterium]